MNKDVICEMDLLRTQKIRFLLGVYRRFKKQQNTEQRLEFIEEVLIILADEPLSPQRTDVSSSFYMRNCFCTRCIYLALCSLLNYCNVNRPCSAVE